jgi:hypothetical protein
MGERPPICNCHGCRFEKPALEQRIRELEIALRTYADPRHWAIAQAAIEAASLLDDLEAEFGDAVSVETVAIVGGLVRGGAACGVRVERGTRRCLSRHA